MYDILQLNDMLVPELLDIAEQLKIPNPKKLSKQDLVYKILDSQAIAGAKNAKPGQDFFPLTVDYIEKTYAAGKIPGGFFKREGKPAEKEVLTSRVIDRPIRPLFPSGWRYETQIIALVLSADTENDTDVLAITGASAALAVSEIPCEKTIAGVRVGDGVVVGRGAVARHQVDRSTCGCLELLAQSGHTGTDGRECRRATALADERA